MLVPPGPVMVICTVPDPAGATAVMCVSETTVNDAAGVDPKRTAVVPVNRVPVKETEVPPAAGPEEGVAEVSVGADVVV